MGAQIAVATLDGRAYFTIVNMLKKLGQAFDAYVPRDVISPDAKLVITTRKERDQVKHPKVTCMEDLGEDLDSVRGRLYEILYGGKDSTFVVGVDPGERIGVASYYQQREFELGVFSSPARAVQRIAQLIEHARAGTKIIRVGYGNPVIAQKILRTLQAYTTLKAHIELVDERGTSSLAGRRKGTKTTRDQRSARIIAFRKGRRIL